MTFLFVHRKFHELLKGFNPYLHLQLIVRCAHNVDLCHKSYYLRWISMDTKKYSKAQQKKQINWASFDIVTQSMRKRFYGITICIRL